MSDRSFMNGVGYSVLDSQWELFDKIIHNIESNKKSQTILAPNAGGKTSMSLLLALKLSRDGHTVLHYSGEAYGLDLCYVCDYMRASKKLFEGIDFTGYRSIHKYVNGSYEFVIIDSAHSCLDTYSLSNKENFRKMLEGANQTIESGMDLSLGQLSIIALDCLGTVIQSNSSFVINFDKNDTPDIGYTPILASDNILTNAMTQEEYIAYINNANEELDAISNVKKMYALKGRMTPEKGWRYDDTQAEIIKMLERMKEEIRGGFSSLDQKVDSIHEDIQFLKNTIRELEASVQDRKNLLELFFSTEPSDEKSAELFITKVSSLITDEITSKMETMSNSQNYHVAEQIVKMKMGEKALSRMGADSLKFLTTAKYLFNQNMNLGEEIDYSSVCLLASKAFEVELSKRFVVGYQDFLQDRGIKFEHWPPALKKTVYTNHESFTVPITVDDFTLGNCPYIMGVKGSNVERKKNQSGFKNYCTNRLMKGISERKVEERCKEYDANIKYVKDYYRNPAAHKSAMGLEAANNCLDYIIEVERVLRKMLEAFEV